MRNKKTVDLLLLIAFLLISFFIFTTGVSAQTIGTANGTNINVRTEPNLKSEIYGKIQTGARVIINGESGDFYCVTHDNRENLFIFKEFLDVSVVESVSIIIDDIPLTAPPVSSITGIIYGDNVNIRKYPSTEHEVLAQAFRGETFQVFGKSGDWYGIIFNNEAAFVYKDYIRGANIESVQSVTVKIPESVPSYGDDETYEMYAVVNSSSGLNLRAKPSTDSAILAVFKFGTAIDVIEKQGDWTKVSLDGTIGFVVSEYVDLNMGTRPANTQSRGQTIVAFSKQFLGTPYVWGGASLTKGVDCSGFVYSVMKNFGVLLSRSSASQFNDGRSINKNELQIGDLVFFDTDGNGRISHVGIFIGGSEFIHSSSSRRNWGVTISSLNEDYYRRTYLRACRVL